MGGTGGAGAGGCGRCAGTATTAGPVTAVTAVAAAGREAGRAQLTAFVTSAAGRALVLRGAADADRAALLGHAAALAEREGHTVVRAAGVEVESALPWAGLHQLLHPLLADAARLDEAARTAFDTVFGGPRGGARAGSDGGPGGAPDCGPPSVMTLGIAVLRLLALATERRPLLLVLDDGQWLDEASADVCGFVGRRLTGRPVRLLVAVRPGLPSRFDAAALPELPIAALPDEPTARHLRLAGTPPRTPPPAPGALTWQERRIADLAASGLTNKQIGARMHLSPRTVSSHLYRVFPKLSVTSRAALRDALTRHAG
ncbi:AAA ATPase-like protein [Kitasatospora sp. SolWspMP-SS2h]|nr:LuxR C-terminal-related transcriptional regulator [Kitasatospora sp. SolWspMP-SS2h]RAJ40041.1 AAA ATPase-like protein [Kitasatospora sp. SolWspMP-SS2h]